MPNKRRKKIKEVKVEMPKEYIPTSLRPPKPEARKEISYVCGGKGAEISSFEVFTGPFPVLLDALESVPEHGNSCSYVIRYNLDGSDEPLYLWNKDRWVRIDE